MISEKQRNILIHTLYYLDFKANKPEDGYEWREVCGLQCALEEAFEIKREEYIQEIELNYPITISEEHAKDLGLC